MSTLKESNLIVINNLIKDLLAQVETLRKDVNGAIDTKTRTKHAQFMTSAAISVFMASLFRANRKTVRILDPGAGIGSLTAALVARLLKKKNLPQIIQVTAYEIDPFLGKILTRTLDLCRHACANMGVNFKSQILQEDFIESIAGQGDLLNGKTIEPYDCVILNPPYGKINSDSDTRRQLRKVGLETSNAYTAFLALSGKILRPGGELVGITPRSFCNGPYFLPFRKYFLEQMAFKRIHEFEARDKAFKSDSVLQENVIMHAVKTTKQPKNVIISISHNPGEAPQKRRVPYSHVVDKNDKDLVISLIHDSTGENAKGFMTGLPATLEDLGIGVSTGRVVDFRATEYLRQGPGLDTVPLIYPVNLRQGRVLWPVTGGKKPQAIVSNTITSELLVPNGTYVIVKRFSAKEERRRILAAIYDGEQQISQHVGFENHLNFYHYRGAGLPQDAAIGLCVFLNSSVVDTYFRLFSGHTQVNATDLRMLRYPTIKQLERLGRNSQGILGNQKLIDDRIFKVLH